MSLTIVNHIHNEDRVSCETSLAHDMRKVGPIQIQSAIPQKQELNEEVASKKINAHDVQSCSIFVQYIYA